MAPSFLYRPKYVFGCWDGISVELSLCKYRPNLNFAVWDGIFLRKSPSNKPGSTVPNAFSIIGTVCISAFEGCLIVIYTVLNEIFAVGTVLA